VITLPALATLILIKLFSEMLKFSTKTEKKKKKSNKIFFFVKETIESSRILKI